MLWINLLLVIAAILCFYTNSVAGLINLPVPHFHQVYGVIDWTEGRTFTVPGTKEQKSILYASCWPVCLSELLVYGHAVNNNRQAIAAAIKQAYDAFADFDDGAHTDLIPDYIAQYYPGYYARRAVVENQQLWTSEVKWRIIIGAIIQNWPLATSITWVRPRPKMFPHAIIIRGYSDLEDHRAAIVNDPAGSFTMTGVWDQRITGENMDYPYEDFFDRCYIFIVPIAQKERLNLFLKVFNL